jgi:hypothetical protein
MAKKSKAKKRRNKRAQARRAEKKANAPNAHVRHKIKTPAGFDTFSDDEALFWVAHGANYLASNYTTGLWDPVLPDMYEGTDPSPEALTTAILARYDREKGVDPRGRPVIAWTVLEKVIQYAYLREVWRAMKEADPECKPRSESRNPRHPIVWRVFRDIKRILLKAAK